MYKLKDIRQDLKDVSEVVKLTKRLEKSKLPMSPNMKLVQDIMEKQQQQLISIADALKPKLSS
jgi:predicted nucleic acid-binding protein